MDILTIIDFSVTQFFGKFEWPSFISEIVNFLKIDNIVLNIAGRGVSALEIISTICGLSCVFLAVRGKVANFWVGYLYNIVLFLLFLQKGLYSSMLLQPISLAINLFGHYRWTHPKEYEEDSKHRLKVTMLDNGKRVIFVATIFIFMFVWGYVLSRIDVWFPNVFSRANLPYFDACILGVILVAQYLSAQKKLDCWGAWLIANISNIILCSMAGLVMMTIVYAAYIVLAIGGFFMWREQMRKEDKKKNVENNE